MQQLKVITTIIISILTMGVGLHAQTDTNSELHKTLKAYDSLLFEVSFNQCKLDAIDTILAEDLEFYHDKGGVTNSKQEFMDGMRNGICSPSNTTKSRRELVHNTLEVFPMYSNGVLYGALQKGEHRFFESYNGKPETSGSIAKFSHLWLLQNDQWQLKRVISYDHKMPKEKKKVKVKVSRDILTTYVGEYQAKKTGMVTISLIESGLQISANKMRAPIFPESSNVFYHEHAPLTFEFVSEQKGKISKIVVRENEKIVEEAFKIN